jgi:beta-glucosidase
MVLLGAAFPATGATSRADDASALAELGVGAVRLPLAWHRLQPRAGELDGGAAEAVAGLLDDFAAAGIGVWACLLELDPPGWFLDEGGFGDDRTAARRWPRYVDQVAERFGDRLAGWVPLADPVSLAERWEPVEGSRQATMHRRLLAAWRDAWLVLRGGPPVATLLRLAVVPMPADDVPGLQRARRVDHLRWRTWPRALRDGTVVVPGLPDLELEALAGATDVLGAAVRCDDGAVPERWAEQLGSMVRRVAEEGPDRPLHLTVGLPAADEQHRAALVDASVEAVRSAVHDGVRIEAVVVSPAVGSADTGALVDADREAQPVADRWRTLLPPS